MPTAYEQMTPAEQAAYVARERKFITAERAGRRWTGKIPGSGGSPPRPAAKVIPSGNWRGPMVRDGTVCAQRDIEIVALDKAMQDYSHVKFDQEEECVSLPQTKRCITQNRDAVPDACDLTKVAFACANESSGMLTPLQVSGLTGLDHDRVKQCIRKLEDEDVLTSPSRPFEGKALPVQVSRRTYNLNLRQPVQETDTEVAVGGERYEWLGESYVTMPPDKRAEVLNKLKSS